MPGQSETAAAVCPLGTMVIGGSSWLSDYANNYSSTPFGDGVSTTGWKINATNSSLQPIEMQACAICLTSRETCPQFSDQPWDMFPVQIFGPPN